MLLGNYFKLTTSQEYLQEEDFLHKLTQAISKDLKHPHSFLEGKLRINEAKRVKYYTCELEYFHETRHIEDREVPNSEGYPSKKEINSISNIWDLKLSNYEEYKKSENTIILEKSHHSKPCPSCKQKGKVMCLKCYGKKELKCHICSGMCNLKCSTCNGKGEIYCWRCSGKGVKETGKDKYDRLENCSYCNGRGFQPCTECRQGYVPCYNCSGRGSEYCPVCAGSGELVCDECKGYQTLDHYQVLVANYDIASKTIYISDPYPGFDQTKAYKSKLQLGHKLFSITKDFFPSEEFLSIQSTPYYRQILGFFLESKRSDNKILSTRITIFENIYLDFTFSFNGEIYHLFTDELIKNHYYEGSKLSEIIELDLVQEFIIHTSKGNLSKAKSILQSISEKNYLSLNTRFLLNAITDSEKIDKAYKEYKNNNYHNAEKILKTVSIAKKKEKDYAKLKRKLSIMYSINTISSFILSLPLLFYSFPATGHFNYVWTSLISISILIFCLMFNHYKRRIDHARFLVAFLIILQSIFIFLIR